MTQVKITWRLHRLQLVSQVVRADIPQWMCHFPAKKKKNLSAAEKIANKKFNAKKYPSSKGRQILQAIHNKYPKVLGNENHQKEQKQYRDDVKPVGLFFHIHS